MKHPIKQLLLLVGILTVLLSACAADQPDIPAEPVPQEEPTIVEEVAEELPTEESTEEVIVTEEESEEATEETPEVVIEEESVEEDVEAEETVNEEFTEKLVRTFEISHEDIRYALYNLFNSLGLIILYTFFDERSNV